MKQKKFVLLAGILVMLIGITLVTVGCDLANQAGTRGNTNDTNQSNNDNHQGNTGGQDTAALAGVWKVSNSAHMTFPQTTSSGVIVQMYLCFTTNGTLIQALEITNAQAPVKNGLYREFQYNYKVLPDNKLEITDKGNSTPQSYTLSGNTLEITRSEPAQSTKAVRVTTPTETQILNAQEGLPNITL